jgi:hypothetical protein
MARLSTLTITTAADSPAFEEELDVIAGIAARDVAPFVDYVGAELGNILGIPAAEGRRLISYHVEGPVVRCKPVGTGSSVEALAELRAVARESAMAIVGTFRERVASERAA